MPTMAFTDAGIRALKFPDKPNQVQYFEVLDDASRSLALCVGYGGTRTWRVVYYVAGKARSRSLRTPTNPGTYPELSIKAARKAARAFDAGHAVAAAEAGTFKEVAEKWLVKYVGKKRLRSTYEIKRQLKVYLYPAWAKVPIFNIDRREVNHLLDSIEKRSGPPMADYCLATIRSIFNWYAVQDHKFNSPLVKGMSRDMREPKDRARSRILDDAEIRLVWEACSKLGSYGSLVRVLLLTAQRLGCVKSMKWADVVDDVWTIPEQHREKGHIGKVKLPKLPKPKLAPDTPATPDALNILAEFNPTRIVGNPYVFPAAKGRGPIASFSRGKKELDALLPKSMRTADGKWVLHDLRRTARSLMSKIGVPRDLAERVLGHTSGGVEAIYDRYKYVPEKSDALQKLADHVAMILNPPDKTNVIRMRKRR